MERPKSDLTFKRIGGAIVFFITQLLSWNQHLIEHKVWAKKNTKSNATFL
jgi:hypothetical protein